MGLTGLNSNYKMLSKKVKAIKVSIEKINLEEAITLYESGWTTKQLAERYHISDNAFSRRLKKAGAKMRTRWDY